MSALTREQLLRVTSQIRSWDKSTIAFDVAIQQVNAHDAALRARLAEVEIELEECKHQNGISARETELEQQLATVTAERDEAVNVKMMAYKEVESLMLKLAARTLTWTTEKPTEAGWWYTKSHRGKRVSVTIQRVKQWKDGGFYLYAGKPVERHDCEWAGPIPLPKEA